MNPYTNFELCLILVNKRILHANCGKAGWAEQTAVALTAGVAALWLERNGRDAVIAEARRRGTTVQNLFRSFIKQTARVPAGTLHPVTVGPAAAAESIRLTLADTVAPRSDILPLLAGLKVKLLMSKSELFDFLSVI